MSGRVERVDEYAGVRVLVAEDNPLDQLVAEAMLSRRGMNVTIAPHGRDALQHLASASFELVLMDCQMPELDGYDTTRALRAGEEAGDRVPVIAMTANAMKGDREQCLAAGMDDYLSKPLRQDDVDTLLRRWLTPSYGFEPATGVDTVDLVDAERVGSLGDQYGDLLRELVEIYAVTTPNVFNALRSAIEADDGSGIRAAAHNLKGASQNVGATFIAGVARAIESDPSRTGAEIDRLVDAFEPTLTRLRAIVVPPVPR